MLYLTIRSIVRSKYKQNNNNNNKASQQLYAFVIATTLLHKEQKTEKGKKFWTIFFNKED